MSKYAYVWCIFGGNDYIAGVLPSAYSVKTSGSKFDCVCMYTPDVTDLDLLRQVFDHIIPVDYISYASKQMSTTRQREIYGSWMNNSYTKWNCLGLTQYEKILFIDGDTIILKNMDLLFALQTPGGTFSSAWGRSFGGSINLDMYPKTHGARVTPYQIQRSIETHGVLVIGTTLLLTPSLSDLRGLKDYISSNLPFGINRSNSMVDEQSLTLYYSRVKGVNWTHIHPIYNYIPWKTNWLTQGETPYIYHYFNINKPWMMKSGLYPDLIPYYNTVYEMIKEYNLTKFYKYVPHINHDSHLMQTRAITYKNDN